MTKKSKNILNILYDYQKDAVVSTDKNDNCMPTGTGKTYVQAAVLASDIRNEIEKI